jgi:hypothetical protein
MRFQHNLYIFMTEGFVFERSPMTESQTLRRALLESSPYATSILVSLKSENPSNRNLGDVYSEDLNLKIEKLLDKSA